VRKGRVDRPYLGQQKPSPSAEIVLLENVVWMAIEQDVERLINKFQILNFKFQNRQSLG